MLVSRSQKSSNVAARVKRGLRRIVPMLDVVLLPLLYPSAWLMKLVRRIGVQRLPLCRAALLNVGVFPIANHYYEPQFDHRDARRPYSDDRRLPAIDWNVDEQLRRLDTLNFAAEIADLPEEEVDEQTFHLKNGQFESGDAEYWYQMIRSVKPSRIIEVGSGHSTRMAMRAIAKNRSENPNYSCTHICIEPYEHAWLDAVAEIVVVRKKIEDIELDFFDALGEDDILFIDSSHIIRPQGDVLFEYLELLPLLRKGVIVHVHDIFSPRNYSKRWIETDVKFWNEQYLLEAFLTHNSRWKVIGALNLLHHHHYERLKKVAPFLTPDREPGSFYMQKVA